MNDFIAGSFSGFAQIIVGHPLDTVKVILQNTKSFNFRTFPIKDYFRGIKYPLLNSTIINSVTFGTNSHLYEKYKNHFVSGFLTGLVVTPFVHIQDIGKIQRQLAKDVSFSHFLTLRGIWISAIRESIALSIYYGSYHFYREKNYSPLLSGGIAGLLNWTATYPIDVIRGRIYGQRISFMEAYKQGYLWKGYSVCAVRAVLVNSVAFYVYEETMKHLRSDNSDIRV